jgi:hypothetical protein
VPRVARDDRTSGPALPAPRDGAGVKEILGDIERWRRGGDRFALATVVATSAFGAAAAGAKLGVSSGGELAGADLP